MFNLSAQQFNKPSGGSSFINNPSFSNMPSVKPKGMTPGGIMNSPSISNMPSVRPKGATPGKIMNSPGVLPLGGKR